MLEVVQQCGPDTVGIVSFIAFLVGVILAFMGAIHLSQSGASIYVSQIVAHSVFHGLHHEYYSLLPRAA
ncbi:MAG: ABC transporter permease [Candidatus Binataceae bacterium]